MQLYLVLMTVVVVVSIVVTFMFKFSATDRLDQVGQLFHRFATSLVRMPEFRIRDKNRGVDEPDFTVLHDTAASRPDWQTDLRNLDNYTVTDTQLSLYNSSVLPEQYPEYYFISDYVNQKVVTWNPITLRYDSLVEGRPAEKLDFKIPGFLEKVPEGLVWNLEQRRWQSTADYSQASALRFWELKTSRTLLVSRAMNSTFLGVLVSGAGRNVARYFLRRARTRAKKTKLMYRIEDVRVWLRECGDWVASKLEIFSTWEYKQYLRFEEKHHYANKLYGTPFQISSLPGVFRKRTKALFEPENATVASELEAINSWVYSAPSNYKYTRELPPLEDFIYLFKKYFSWTYEGALDDLISINNFFRRGAAKLVSAAAPYMAAD